MATTLSQFYSDKGQALPSVQQRGSLAAQAGIQGYTGTVAQNNQLLNFMQSSGTGTTGTQGLSNITTPTIPINIATGNQNKVQLPQTQTGNTSTEVSGISAGYLAMPALNTAQSFGTQINQANQVANQNAQQGQQDYQTQVLGLINQMQNRPGELEKQYNIQQLSQDAMKAKANYDSVELSYRRKKESVMNDASLTSDQKSAVIGDIDRKEASQKADIAIDYNLKAGLLSNAKELMQKQIELELEPMKLKVDYYKDNRDRFDKILDKTEMRQYDYIQKREERAYQAAQQNAKMINDLKLEAVKNGIPYDQVKGIKSIDDYARLTNQRPSDVIVEAQAKSTIQNIDDAIKNKGGLAGAVGPRWWARREVFRPGKVQSFLGTVAQIAGQLTIDKLSQAKANGATFGALSDSEQLLLASSASKLGAWSIKDKSGNITGYKVPETEVKKELNKIKQFAILDYERRTGKTYTTEEDPAGIGIDTTMLDPAGILQ